MTRQKSQMIAKGKIPFATMNELDKKDFVQIIGPVFEHSEWIAEATWAKRPFADLNHLNCSLCETVKKAGEEKQFALICAHPDLAGRVALTRESANEQAGAGLDKLSPEEMDLFQKQNAAYKKRFGFPFVICARLNRKKAILDGFRARLANSREQEIQTALQEIFKIAELRLNDLISN